MLLVCVWSITDRILEVYIQSYQYDHSPAMTQRGPIGPSCFMALMQEGVGIASSKSSTEAANIISSFDIRHPACLTSPNPLPLATAEFVLVILTALTIFAYFADPLIRIVRHRLLPLRMEALPDLRDTIMSCQSLAGVRVRFLIDIHNSRVGGTALGCAGWQFIVLNRGLISLGHRNTDAFRAILLHELAHIKNRDLNATAFTLAAWRVFILSVVIPSALLIAFVRIPTATYSVPDTLWQLAVMTLAALLARNAVLRHREYQADMRAVSWSSDSSSLERLLKDANPAMTGHVHSETAPARWLPRITGRLLQLHPTPLERREYITRMRPQWLPAGRELATLGLVTGLAAPTILVTAPWPDFLPSAGLREGWQLAVLTVPVALAVAPAIWRSTLSARNAKVRDWTALLGLPFGAGLATGVILTPVNSGFALMPLAAAARWEMLWCAAALLGCFLFIGWISLTARTWQLAAPPIASAVATTSSIAAAALLTSWLAPLLYARLLLPITDVTISAFAKHFLFSDLKHWFSPAHLLGTYLLGTAAITGLIPAFGLAHLVAVRVIRTTRASHQASHSPLSPETSTDNN